jgi:hypothetical protein
MLEVLGGWLQSCGPGSDAAGGACATILLHGEVAAAPMVPDQSAQRLSPWGRIDARGRNHNLPYESLTKQAVSIFTCFS